MNMQLSQPICNSQTHGHTLKSVTSMYFYFFYLNTITHLSFNKFIVWFGYISSSKWASWSGSGIWQGWLLRGSYVRFSRHIPLGGSSGTHPWHATKITSLGWLGNVLLFPQKSWSFSPSLSSTFHDKHTCIFSRFPFSFWFFPPAF